MFGMNECHQIIEALLNGKDCFSIASVLNPICKLLSRATNVFGPDTTTLYFCVNVSIKTVFFTTSQYKLSVGKNIIPKSVVYGEEEWKKVIETLLPKYREEKRASGFTTSYKLGFRVGDAAAKIMLKLA